uniref:Putative lipocalin-5 1 n=1 Tax=Amblyomma triste TaxID=251400 RepID=A0A023G965_AMBTT
MRPCLLAFSAATALSLMMSAGAGPSDPANLQREPPDMMRIFEAFPNATAIMDIDNDSILDCLTARRTEMDPENKTATYMWSLQGSDGKTRIHVPVYHMAGNTPDMTLYIFGSKNNTPEVGYFRYTDYKNCVIFELPHFGHQCTLWVSEAARDSIPDYCLKQHANICGAGITIYKDTCKDSE